MDGFGPVCPVCMAKWGNGFQSEALRLALPQVDGPVRMVIVEMLRGDGYEDCCDCGHCHRGWFHRGWVCPPRWQRHLFLENTRGWW